MKYFLPGLSFVIFYILIGIKHVCSCGTLKFEKENVTECQTARLIYTPNANYAERKWLKERNNEAKQIYDHAAIHDNSKYSESKIDGNFILSISEVTSTDVAAYVIRCAEHRITSSTHLKVTANPTGPGCDEKCGKLSVLESNIIEGDPVTFYFYVEIGKSVTWEKNESTTFQQLEGKRYTNTVIQGYERQSYNISKAQYSDNGEYRVNCGDTVSNSVFLNIDYSRPTNPEFSDVKTELYCKSDDGCILATVDKPIKVECFVKGGSEPVELIMLKNRKEITNASQETEEKNTITFHYVKYNFTPTKSDIDATFTCRVKNPALSAPLASSVLVYVTVTPTKIDFIPNEVKEGKQSEIKCVSMNGRPPLKSDLYIGSSKEHDIAMISETVPGDLHTVTTSATKVFSRYQNQVKIKCCSTVGDGICNETNINVLFPPKTVTVQEISNQNEENGDTMITLKFAVAESNPRSYIEINGLKHVQPELVNEKYETENKTNGWRFTAIWTFNFTRHYNMKELTCEVQNDGFPDLELSSIYKLNITYYPIVTISGREQKTVYVGDDIVLVCSVDSYPPSTLSWHNHAGIIKEIFEADAIEIHFTNVSSAHSQTYSCKANNGIGGTVSKDITVSVKDPSERPYSKACAESNIASVLGPIIVCTFVILIAIFVAFISRKRRQNAPSDGGHFREINIEENNASLRPTGNDTNMHAGYEYLDMQNSSKESKLYTTLNTEIQAGYESLAGQDTTTEKDMYTNLAESQTSTELHFDYEDSEL